MPHTAMLHSSLTAYIFVIIQLVCAQSSTQLTSAPAPSVLTQHIVHPAHKDILVPGSTSTIQWDANDHFKNVTLQLWDHTSWGYSHDLLTPCFPWGRNSFCGTIAMHVPNTGSFEWYIPNPTNGSLGYGFPRDEQVFWVKIFVEDYINEEIGNHLPVVSWSQNFAFAADGESGTIVDATTTSTDGIPVLVTQQSSATSNLGATSTIATTSATAKSPSAHESTMLPSAQGDALKLKGSVPLLGVMFLASGFL
jgi:hypothetical protein